MNTWIIAQRKIRYETRLNYNKHYCWDKEIGEKMKRNILNSITNVRLRFNKKQQSFDGDKEKISSNEATV